MDPHAGSSAALQMPSVRATLGKTWDFDLIDIGPKAKRVLGLSSPTIDASITSALLRLDWRILYRERLELDRRWSGVARSRGADDAMRRMGGVYDLLPSSMPASVCDDPPSDQGYEPKKTQIPGHTDRWAVLHSSYLCSLMNTFSVSIVLNLIRGVSLQGFVIVPSRSGVYVLESSSGHSQAGIKEASSAWNSKRTGIANGVTNHYRRGTSVTPTCWTR